MAQFRVLTNPEDWEPFKKGYEASGGVFPVSGCAVMFAEFDDDGNPVACQFLQEGMFAEGLFVMRPGAHIRSLGNMLLAYVNALGCKGKALMTMIRNDDQGERIGAYVEHMGFEKVDCSVYRRVM